MVNKISNKIESDMSRLIVLLILQVLLYGAFTALVMLERNYSFGHFPVNILAGLSTGVGCACFLGTIHSLINCIQGMYENKGKTILLFEASIFLILILPYVKFVRNMF